MKQNYHTTGPLTEKQAADRTAGHRHKHALTVLEMVCAHQWHTGAELAKIYRIKWSDKYEIRRRLSDLHEENLVQRLPKKCRIAGTMAMAYAITDEGKRVLFNSLKGDSK